MYKLITVTEFEQEVQKLCFEYDDGRITWIPMIELNYDYQNYLEWLERGNTPVRVTQ